MLDFVEIRAAKIGKVGIWCRTRVDWVFNASPVLKERAEMMARHEGMTYERDVEKRAPYAQRSLDFIDRITDTLSKKMVQKVKNRWDDDVWPWDRDGFRRQRSAH